MTSGCRNYRYLAQEHLGYDGGFGNVFHLSINKVSAKLHMTLIVLGTVWCWKTFCFWLIINAQKHARIVLNWWPIFNPWTRSSGCPSLGWLSLIVISQKHLYFSSYTQISHPSAYPLPSLYLSISLCLSLSLSLLNLSFPCILVS